MDTLWDLQDILDVEIHVGTTDISKKDEEDSKQTKLEIYSSEGMESTKLVKDVPSIGAPSACCLGGLLHT